MVAWIRRLSALVRNLFPQPRFERELDDELRAYLDQLTAEKRRAGLGEAQARRAALLELDGIEQVKEEVRGARAGQLLRDFGQDVRYAMRTLRKSPGFTLVAALALALGIGANSAMFSVAYGILQRPLPYGEADRLVAVYLRYFPRDFAYGTLCIRDYLMWKEDNRVFEEPSLFRSQRLDIGGKEGVPEQVQGASVTAGFFPTLRVRPLLGRAFTAGEDQPGAPALVVLSEPLWRRRFAASPAVLGETILVNGAPATIIGVMPGEVLLPRRETEAWTNLIVEPPKRYGPWLYRGVARLKPGVTLAQAEAETSQIAQRMMRLNPYYQRLTLPLLPLRDALLGANLRPAMLILAGAVGLVLLIAVVNVANLLLARATIREREMALRLSLGASRGRVVRQLLTESVILSALGGVAGLLLAALAVRGVRVWNPGNLPLIDSVRLDGIVVAFTTLVSVLTGVIFGLVPAFAGARADLNSTIKEGGRSGSAAHARGRTRAALVIAEIALSLTLLVGAGLLMRSFANLQQVNGGFLAPPRRVLTMLISPGSRKYAEEPAGIALYDDILRRVRAVPGVEVAAITDSLPPDGQGDADSFRLEGQKLAPGEMNPIVTDATVTPDYFETLRIPLRRGRAFNPHDTATSPPVTIVSEAFARRFFPNQDAIGKRLGYGNRWMTIVGIVGNVKYLGLRADTDPAYYMPLAQNYGQRMNLVLRTSGGDAALLAETLRAAVQAADPGLTIARVTTMDRTLALSVSQPRFDTMLLALFAAIALLLASVGIYGLISYSVAQRTHEIGVRMALGAARADVVRMIVRQGASLALGGIALGLAGAFALTRLLESMLFGIGATDVVTFAAAPFGMFLVVLLATFVPALRATRISPITAIRCD